MKTSKTYLIFFAVMTLLLVPNNISAFQGGDVAVVVNPANPIDSISLADLHKVFGGDKPTFTPYVRNAGTRERDVLLKVVMKMTEAQFQDYWVKKVYSGQAAHEPLAVPSNNMQQDGVRSQKGGIALVSQSEVGAGVKVIKVDGIMPGGPGYPLK